MSDNEPQLSDAEKIRLKRLARLGGGSTTSSATSTSATPPPSAQPSEAHQPQPGPSASSRLLNTKLPSQASTSSSQAATSASSTPRPPAARPVKRPSPANTASEQVATPPARKPAAPARLPISYPEWEAQKIQTIFSVTLSRGDAQRSDWSLCWLKELREEIESEAPDQPITVSAALADRLLIARLSLDPKTMSNSVDSDMLEVLAGMPQNETTFEYLAGCWKRLYIAIRDTNRHTLSTEDKASWTEAVDKCRGLVISYIGMTLEDPSMFPQPEGKPLGPAEFLPLLLSVTSEGSSSDGDPLTSNSAPRHNQTGCLASADLLPFLNDLAAGFSDDMLGDVLTPTLSLFFQDWFKITPSPDLLGNEWRRYLGAISLLVQVKDIAASLPTLGVWLSKSADASRVEWQSLLGPLARQSVYPREFAQIWRTYFSDPTDRNVKDIDANKDNLRQTLTALQTSLFHVYNSIVRASPASREKILDYFGHIVRLNKKRAGMRVDYRTVSSDGFMTNLQVILLKLFEPVMDTSFSKIDKIDPRYFQNTRRVDIEEETKVKATKEEADAYYGTGDMEVDKTAPNFISDLFFLLNAYQHFGLAKTIGNRTTAERNLSDIQKELKRAEASRGDWAGNPATTEQGEATIKKLKGDLATLHASIHAYDTQLLDPGLTRLNLTFIGYVMTWLVRQVDPKHAFPQNQIELPLPDESPKDFRMLPEYLFENVAEYIEFLSRYNAEALDDADKDILITFTIVFLSPGYVNNPFMKAKLVSGLSNGVIPQGYWRKGPLYERLGVHPLSTQYLMPTLIRFFIDVEMTGGHTQFWDKFNFRRDISRIIKAMWSNPLHRQAFIQTRHDDFDQFIRFTNMLMSDTTFHLEESLTGLAKINNIEGQKANVESWNALPAAERDDLVQTLRQTESSCPFHTSMGLDHIELMRDLTATTREPFVTGEIVDRLAATLDENLATLVGPKMSELKVADPDRFNFKPKKLLAALAQVYLNLAPEGDFIRAVADDGRSYSKELFERFARTLKNRAIMTDAEVAGVIAFAQKVEDMKATIMIEDEREIPDEFLDPLMSTLMKDPVILPVSRVVIDRATIRTVLLSKELDPFNNVPLKYEELIADTELKAKIDAWVASGKAGPADDVMDVEQL